jgi:hypothetical protein
MTREAFIKKWLGNRDYQYTEQNRDLMRDDLGKVIARNIGCQCKDRTGETSIMCCNNCGLPTEEFWVRRENKS